MKELPYLSAFRFTERFKNICRVRYSTSQDLTNCLMSEILCESGAAVGHELLNLKHGVPPIAE
jgi:hypothetical protein